MCLNLMTTLSDIGVWDQIGSLMRNSVWSLMGIIAAAIALVIALSLYILQRTVKELTCAILSTTLVVPLIELEPKTETKIQLLFDGQIVNNARILILRIWNSGKRPIQTQDYENNMPLMLYFGEEVEIIDTEVLDANPISVKDIAEAHLNVGKKSLLLGPLQLKSRDSITIKVLINNYNGKLDFRNTRIAGISQIIVLEKFPDKALSPLSGSALRRASLSSIAVGVIIFAFPITLAIIFVVFVGLILLLLAGLGSRRS